MELKFITNDGQLATNISVSDALFGREYNEALVHQVVTAYMANTRSANRAQKGRSDVAKSTHKPWRQKVQDVLVLVWPLVPYGAAVEKLFPIVQKRILVIR